MIHNTALETKILGSLIAIGTFSNEIIQKTMLQLTADCFYNVYARNIYQIIVQQYNSKQYFDAVSMIDLLVNCSNDTYELFSDIQSNTLYISSNLEFDIDTLIMARDLRKQTSELAQALKLVEVESDYRISKKTLSEALNRVLTVSSKYKAEGESYDQLADDYLCGKHEESLPVATGINKMDQMLDGGILKKSLVTIAAGPGVGKTNFSIYLMNGLINNAPNQQVLFFSLEMENKIIWKNHASIIAQKRFNLLSQLEQSNVIAKLLTYDVKLFDGSSPNIDFIENTARLASMNKPISVIVIDYLGLVQNKGHFERNDLKHEDTAKRLAALAKDLNCIVIALCQINRKNADRARDDRCPYPHDASDSSGTHRASTLWFGVDRPEMYMDDPLYKDMFVIKCRKNRFGRLFEMNLAFNDGLFAEVLPTYINRPFKLKENSMF